jgi:hypothetical protein
MALLSLRYGGCGTLSADWATRADVDKTAVVVNLGEKAYTDLHRRVPSFVGCWLVVCGWWLAVWLRPPDPFPPAGC